MRPGPRPPRPPAPPTAGVARPAPEAADAGLATARRAASPPPPTAVPSKWVGGWKRPRGLPHHTPVSGAPDWGPSPIARVPRSQGGRLSIQLSRAGA